MYKRRILKAAAFLLGFSCSPLLLIGAYPGSLSEAACPQPGLNNGWYANSTVYYQATGFANQQELDQLGGGGALGSWNFGNNNEVSQTLYNCSRVYFSNASQTARCTLYRSLEFVRSTSTTENRGESTNMVTASAIAQRCMTHKAQVSADGRGMFSL